ncbi:MAG: aminoacyl--tRNA ligase-related protein [Patescibacteria group bacterium UBA2163]
MNTHTHTTHGMRQSELFTKTRREAPKGEISKNAQLLIRAGYIHKELAGVYALLPLGLRVIEKIQHIVREELNALGAQEIRMTTLQRKELWEQTDRWSDENVDVWFKSELHAGGEVGFGWSHEEPIAAMLRDHVHSFRDLPVNVHQFQNKLRNELRAKSGIMRGREFIMNDMYSFDVDEESHRQFYNKTIEAYKRIFDRVGVGGDTYVTFASGGAFTEFSHEFQTITEAGEDIIYINREKNIAINEEVLTDETLTELGITRDSLEEVATAEVGNIFNFGTKKSEQLDLTFKNEKGEITPVWMGSYGIGITRLMGVLAEKCADEKGLVWPESVAPFTYHLVVLSDDESARDEADSLYEALISHGIDVLYDDRSVSAGEKFTDSELLGIPYRIVYGKKSTPDMLEVVRRATGETLMMSRDELLRR